MRFKEWDKEANYGVGAEKFSARAECVVWWRCGKCGKPYRMSIAEKAEGGACPYCRGERRYEPESLMAKALEAAKPRLIEEWDEKLNKIRADEVLVSSEERYFWKCKVCGFVWTDSIRGRLEENRGCYMCGEVASHTSLPQLIIVHYLKQLFPDTVHRYRYNAKSEIDVYVPSIKLAIEYDGDYYHAKGESAKKDRKKDGDLVKLGMRVVRFRDLGCILFKDSRCEIITFNAQLDYVEFEKELQKFLDGLRQKYGIEKEVKVCIEEVDQLVAGELYAPTYEMSLAFALKERALKGKKGRKGEKVEDVGEVKWDYEANWPVVPEEVWAGSNRKYHWVCGKVPEHKWVAMAKSVVAGHGCMKCAKNHPMDTAEWIEKARKVHGDKYDYSKVVYVTATKPVTIICPVHGEFQQTPSGHLTGRGCQYCCGRAFHPADVITNTYPQAAEDWDAERNLKDFGVKLEEVGIHDTRKFWWKCVNGKPHSYLSNIDKKYKQHRGCGVCRKRQPNPDDSSN